jgi:dihydrofolate synthase/folylpolyglutamate synthase
MFCHLLPRVRTVIATRSEHPRAMHPDMLVELAQQYGKNAIKTLSVEQGLEEAMKQAGKDAVVVVAGSIFIAAAVREILLNR